MAAYFVDATLGDDSKDGQIAVPMVPSGDLVRGKALWPLVESLMTFSEQLNELKISTAEPRIREIATQLYEEQYRELDALRSECVIALKLLREKGIVTREEMAAIR